MDRRLLKRTVEVAGWSKAFDARKLLQSLRVAFDVSALEGAGRIEDTINFVETRRSSPHPVHHRLSERKSNLRCVAPCVSHALTQGRDNLLPLVQHLLCSQPCNVFVRILQRVA
jgi:hypothetical protein